VENKIPSIHIIVAVHKKYLMPKDSLYLPLHVGAEGKKDSEGKPLNLGYQKDNTGENISVKNPGYCELTGLYWAWKNLDADYIGLVHYRRYFGHKNSNDLNACILHEKDLLPYIPEVKIFVPKKRKYYIETLYSHYAHTHYPSQLDETRTIISAMCPEYLTSYDRVVKHTYGYMFNMCIMRRDWLDQYCSWLFPILFELENRVDATQLSKFQGRFYGRISEIIFNVWLDHQLETGALKKTEIKELPSFMVEKVNWWKKGTHFLKAKFFGKKYEGSF
jgi:hypothetical protein